MWQIIVLVLIAILSPLAGLIVGLRLLYAAITNRAKAWQIAIGWDDLASVATNGWLGQTISYRAATARTQNKRWGCLLCRWLDDVDRGHCDRALVDKKQNLQLPAGE